MRPKELGKFVLLDVTASERQNGLRRIFFARRETITVEFREGNADHEPRALVAVDEWMVPDNPGCVDGPDPNDVSRASLRVMLPRVRLGKIDEFSSEKSTCRSRSVRPPPIDCQKPQADERHAEEFCRDDALAEDERA